MHSTDLIFHLLVYKSICSEMGVKDAKHQRPKSLTPISGQIQYSQANEGLFVDPSSRSANLICSKNLICDKMLASNMITMGERGYEFLKQNYLVKNTYNAIMRHF